MSSRIMRTERLPTYLGAPIACELAWVGYAGALNAAFWSLNR